MKLQVKQGKLNPIFTKEWQLFKYNYPDPRYADIYQVSRVNDDETDIDNVEFHTYNSKELAEEYLKFKLNQK